MFRRFFSNRRNQRKDIATRRSLLHGWFGLRVTVLRCTNGNILTFPPLATGRLVGYTVEKDHSTIRLLADTGERVAVKCDSNTRMFCDDIAGACR